MKKKAKTLQTVSILILLILVVWSFWYEPSTLHVQNYELKIDGASQAGFSGLTIAIIADLHAGAPYIDAEKIHEVVDRTNAVKPDIILLAGDYVQHVLGGKHIPFSLVAASLQKLRAPLGVYAVMGNHDGLGDYGDITGALTTAGITVLGDRSLEVKRQEKQSFFLAGISDYYAASHNVQRALQNVPSQQKALCLTHTPDIFPELPSTCLLTIAGHTHGGQVNLPVLGRLIVPSHYGAHYAAGLIAEQEHYLFVSTGIGTSIIPVRLNVPPEISVLHIL